MSHLHDQPLYRPPAEGRNLIIQATLGCSFNRCSFCAMYRTRSYTARILTDVFEDIHAAAQAWPDARRVFLADGDALTLPTAHLLAILAELQRALPRLTRVACYATPVNIRRKSVNELRQLREHRLSLLYVGVESGNDEMLKRITKGATARGIKEALHKAHNAGMKVSATVILGLGGRRHWREHIDDTVRLLNRAPVSYLSTLQLTLDERIAAEFMAKFGEPFEAQDDTAILLEQQRFIHHLQPAQAVVFRSDHASNALALAGNLVRDRERLLGQIEQALNRQRPLRPAHLRGL